MSKDILVSFAMGLFGSTVVRLSQDFTIKVSLQVSLGRDNILLLFVVVRFCNSKIDIGYKHSILLSCGCRFVR